MAHTLRREINLETGVIVHEVYREGNVRHRDPREGPAEIWRDAATGVTVRESYMWRGRLHRDDGPAEIERDAVTGVVCRHAYWCHDLPHRDSREGPSETYWDHATGRIAYYEVYYTHDKPFRADGGPCIIDRDEKTGEIISAGTFTEPGTPEPEPTERQKRHQRAYARRIARLARDRG